jgi:hypothetical protein
MMTPSRIRLRSALLAALIIASCGPAGEDPANQAATMAALHAGDAPVASPRAQAIQSKGKRHSFLPLFSSTSGGG